MGHSTNGDMARKKRAFASGSVNVGRICDAKLDNVAHLIPALLRCHHWP